MQKEYTLITKYIQTSSDNCIKCLLLLPWLFNDGTVSIDSFIKSLFSDVRVDDDGTTFSTAREVDDDEVYDCCSSLLFVSMELEELSSADNLRWKHS